MDHTQPMHIDTKAIPRSEASSLLHDTPEVRPYQAYCDTEIPSCPPSPENLAPSPLRVRKVYLEQIDMSAQASIIDASEQEISLTRVATSGPDKQVDFSRSIPMGSHIGKQNQRMDQRSFLGITSSATSDHPTQPINLRGSHSPSDDEVTAYDSESAIARVQPPEHIDRVTERTIPRRPVPENMGVLGITYRPLPQVPLEKVQLESQDRSQSTSEHVCAQCPLRTMEPTDERMEERDGKIYLRYRHGVHDATVGLSDQFEDINLESPNAQLPPQIPEPAFQTRFHRRSHELFFQVPSYTRPHPAPLLHSSTDLQNGPRPPPWGTYDDLALQRRQRNERRGRTYNTPVTIVQGTTLTHQQTLSVVDGGEGLSREVNEYREQILRVYPDMAFDGHAGEGGREFRCCVVM
ncbi:hypothetical protein COCCADRAFT_99990 [Bipolaris zeicola 26-R-13]|uniref:Uncharacterized protein n=1 Tax=Cochliobolus carbonum (strain 26-R-13) TaxID=930089 RepID=W6Y218_COCC2|nr:uncharacterized protein COCCADRAFT_99990 [Bipolaris zeicola 26-R-13]EUC31948.1 hypothetical protein COCCADRAFT_99990 [Bipolaris zeicola 26-R-13]